MENEEAKWEAYARMALELNEVAPGETDFKQTVSNLKALAAHRANFRHLASADSDEIALRFEANPNG